MMVFHPVSEMNPFFPEPAGNIHKEEVPFLGLQVAEVRECSKVHYFDSKDRLPLWQERFGLDIRKSSSFRGCLGTEQTPQGMVTALRLPELQECLGDALREGQAGIFLCGPFWGQTLDRMILVLSLIPPKAAPRLLISVWLSWHCCSLASVRWSRDCWCRVFFDGPKKMKRGRLGILCCLSLQYI